MGLLAATWTEEHQQAALAQGWGIFHDGVEYQLQRLDSPEDEAGEPIEPVFRSDLEAAHFVRRQAAKEDSLALFAIAFLVVEGSSDIRWFARDRGD